MNMKKKTKENILEEQRLEIGARILEAATQLIEAHREHDAENVVILAHRVDLLVEAMRIQYVHVPKEELRIRDKDYLEKQLKAVRLDAAGKG